MNELLAQQWAEIARDLDDEQLEKLEAAVDNLTEGIYGLAGVIGELRVAAFLVAFSETYRVKALAS